MNEQESFRDLETTKRIPVKIVLPNFHFELMGRYSETELDSLKRHIDMQLKSKPNAQMMILLYLVEKV